MNSTAVRAILGLIGDAESLASVETYHAELVATIAAVFPCEIVSFNEFWVDRPAGARGSPAVTCTSSPPLEPRDAMPVALLPAFFATWPTTR